MRAFLWFLAFLTATNVLAAEKSPIPMTLKNVEGGLNIERDVSIFEDATKKLQISDFLKDGKLQDKFSSDHRRLSFGFSSHHYWMRWQLENTTDKALTLVVALSYPMLDFADLYTVGADGAVGVQKSGDALPYSTRPLPGRAFSYPITLPAGSSLTYYLHVHSTSALTLPLVIWDRDSFQSSIARDQTIFGMYFGVLAGILLYNSFIFFATGFSRSYGAYILLMMCSVMVYLGWTGVGVQFLWGDSQFMTQRTFAIFANLLSATLCVFQIFFMDLKTNAPRIYKLYRWFIGYAVIACLACMFIPLNYAQKCGSSTGAICALFSFSVGFWLMLRKNRQAMFFTLAWSVFLLFIVLGGSIALGLLNLPITISIYGSQMGSALESILLAIGLADRINQLQSIKVTQALKIKEQWGQLEAINGNLENLVAEKTQEVRSLLDFIPHGVFSIEPDLKLARQYSAHLPILLGTEDIGGRDFVELILNRSNLLHDEKDRLIQSLKAVIGEDEIAFETNLHNFPNEFMYTDPLATSKTFQLTWNIEVAGNGLVKKMLITVLDNTQAKVMEDEIKRQQTEMNYVKELIECGAEKFAQFSETVDPLLKENQDLTDHVLAEKDNLKIMFVNAHTVKGAARTLGLSVLSNAVHEAENYYTDIMKSSVALDLNRLKQDMGTIRTVFNHYNRISRETLGRQNDRKKILLDRELLGEHCNLLLGFIQQRDAGQRSDVEAAKISLEQISNLVYADLPVIVASCFNQVFRVAKDLGKPAPELRLDVARIRIPQRVEDALRKAAIHIIRNAMDHGIETPEERVLAGKTAAGLLKVESHFAHSILELIIQDDGRGLNMKKLREKGVKAGLLSDDASLPAIARTVFADGVPTSYRISHISGRGIGMNAVKKFVEEAGGSIEVVLLESLDAAGDFYRFETRIRFPLLEIHKDM